MKNPLSKVAHNWLRPFYFTVKPRPKPTAQNWFFILRNLGTRHLFSYLWFPYFYSDCPWPYCVLWPFSKHLDFFSLHPFFNRSVLKTNFFFHIFQYFTENIKEKFQKGPLDVHLAPLWSHQLMIWEHRGHGGLRFRKIQMTTSLNPLIMGCFIYILDSSNSSSITFWTT